MKKNEINRVQTNHNLLNIITPITGMEYKQSRMRIGDNFAKIYTVIKYPKNVKVGWLSKLSNIPNTISVQLFEPSDNTLLIENMSRGIRQSEMIYDSSKDALVRNSAIYFIAAGGAGALYANCVTKVENVAFEDLLSESIKKLTIKFLRLLIPLSPKDLLFSLKYTSVILFSL